MRAPARAGLLGRSDIATAGLILVALHVALVPLFFDASAMVAFGIPKALLGQALATLLLGAIVAVVLTEGPRALRLGPLHAFVGVLAVVYVLATVFALNDVVAIRGAVDRGLGLLALLDGVVLFLAVPVFVRTRRDATWVAAAFFGAAIPVLLYQVVQAADLDPLPWQGAEGGRDRQISTLGNATVLGQYLASITVAAIALALQRDATLSRRTRLALLGLGVAAAVGTLGAGTRATVVGLASAALMAAVAWLLRRRPGARRWLPLALAATLALGAAALALTPAGDRFGAAIAAVAERDGSTRARLLLYDVAIRMTADRPVLGLGPDNFTAAFPAYRPENAHRILSGSAIETSTHSWVLYHATSAGLVGLAAFTVMSAVALFMALRAGGPAAIAAAIVLAQFLGTGLLTVNDPGTEWIYWLALGTIAAARPTRAVEAEERVRGSRGGAPRALPWVIVAIAALLTVPAWQWMDAGRWAEQSQRHTQAGRRGPALEAARAAVSTDPGRAEYWNELGRAHANLEQYIDAERAFERAVSIAPYHSVILSNLVRAQVGRGITGDRASFDRAYETAKRAVATDPNTAYVHYALALAASQTGRVQEAIDESERGWVIDRPSGQQFAYEVAVRAYLSVGRTEDAHRWADAGAEAQPSPFLLTVQGRIALDQGDYAQALKIADAALAIDPGYALAQELRADALRLLGR